MQLRDLSRNEIREIDRRAIDEFGVPGVALMENAGREAARWLAAICRSGPIVICCGKGNNGGDGYVMARHLDAWEFEVHVVLACSREEIKGDALTNFKIIEASGIPITHWAPDDATDARVAELLRGAARIVDGLLGTGMTGDVREPLRSAIETLNAASAPKFAIDIPSGLDADTGLPLGVAVRASHTATFVARKRGFLNPEAGEFTGEVRVFDIGVPREILKQYSAIVGP
jgi:NAD(P)H-hydrate epimerase